MEYFSGMPRECAYMCTYNGGGVRQHRALSSAWHFAIKSHPNQNFVRS